MICEYTNLSRSRIPRRVNGAGYLTGLSMLIDPRLEDYYAALFSFYGVQVLVHSYQDYPEISARGILLSPQKEAFLQVSSHVSSFYCSIIQLQLLGLWKLKMHKKPLTTMNNKSKLYILYCDIFLIL